MKARQQAKSVIQSKVSPHAKQTPVSNMKVMNPYKTQPEVSSSVQNKEASYLVTKQTIVASPDKHIVSNPYKIKENKNNVLHSTSKQNQDDNPSPLSLIKKQNKHIIPMTLKDIQKILFQRTTVNTVGVL